jgi:transcriptional regulator with XRE-family HTH domain
VDRLHDERVKAGLTQEDVADWMGTTQSAVSEWEAGRTHPGVGFIDRWASLFGLHLDFMED